MSNFLHKIKDFLLDLLFPKKCVGCQQEGQWICDSCKSKIILIQKPTCPKCNRISRFGQVCSKCRDQSNLTGVIVAAYYKEGPLKEAIHTMKYDGVFDLSKDLSQILIKVLRQKKPNKTFVIIPVPLHRARRAERGFNQAEILAKNISSEFGNKLIKKKLIRTKHKKPQITLSGKERRDNVKGIFSWRGGLNELRGRTVILVDDVYTTGSTLEECAKVLRNQAGVKQVWGLVLAKV